MAAGVGRPPSCSVAVPDARVAERMNVPYAGPVTVPVGEEVRPGSRPAVTGRTVRMAVNGV